MQPEVEILPELSFRNHGREIAVGGCDQTDVGEEHLISTHPLKGLFTQHTKDLHLNRRINFADLIEKKSSSRRLFKTSYPALSRSGVSPFFMTKELALQQLR